MTIKVDTDTAQILLCFLEFNDFGNTKLEGLMAARLHEQIKKKLIDQTVDKRRERPSGRVPHFYGPIEILRKHLLKKENTDLLKIVIRQDKIDKYEKQRYKRLIEQITIENPR
jgi:hypothetical protein